MGSQTLCPPGLGTVCTSRWRARLPTARDYINRRRAKKNTGMAGNLNSGAAPLTSSLCKLQALNGLFAIYKKPGPTSADILNMLKESLLKGETTLIVESAYTSSNS